MTPDQLAEYVQTTFPRTGPFKPFAHYDPDGDCIEFFVSPESFVAERVDTWVTVYHGEHSNEVIGSLIKGVSKLLEQFPGLVIDIECGRVRIAHILRARAWASGDELVRKSYKKIIQVADAESIIAELQCA